MSDSPYTVTTHGSLTADGVWSIEARVEFRDGPPALGSDLLRQAEIALRDAIATEAERGKRLGPRTT